MNCTVCNRYRPGIITIEVAGLTAHPGCAHDVRDAVKLWPRVNLVDGVLRWDSNGRTPFEDTTRIWLALGYVTAEVVAATQATNTEESSAAIAAYAAGQRAMASAEESYELRAAFGPGVEVVDVLTGRRTRS